MIHVAIIHKRYLDAILAGEKTIEARLSKIRTEPFGRVKKGERIYFKQSSGPFRATAVIRRVKSFDDLSPSRVRSMRREYNTGILGDTAFWTAKSRATCATLMWLAKVELIDTGPDLSTVQPRGSRRAWFVLTDEFDVYPTCAANCSVLPTLRPAEPARA